MAALPQHIDINVPAPLLGRVGTLLAGFDRLLKEAGVATRREAKEPGNHVTPWWLKAKIYSGKSYGWVTYGETDYAKVNPVPHLWAEAKAQLRAVAYEWLYAYGRQLAAPPAAAPAPAPLPPPPARPAPRYYAKAEFNGEDFGNEYLAFRLGDEVLPCCPPSGIDAAGWAYGRLTSGARGWYPPSYCAEAARACTAPTRWRPSPPPSMLRAPRLRRGTGVALHARPSRTTPERSGPRR